jgi:hypothetical protein
MMHAMIKGRAGRPSRSPQDAAGERPRGKRSTPIEPNAAFLRAMADALRDILADEQRRAA